MTGSTGFLGSALVTRLLAENVKVTCLFRSQSISKAHAFADGRRICVVEAPSFETSVLQSKLAGLSAEVIFHLASYGVEQADRDIDQLVEGNVSIVLHLLRATAHWPLRRFVHTGTCSEYGYPGPRGTLIAETHSVQPRSLYGAVKAASVLCGNALASSLSIPFVTLRLFGVFWNRKPFRAWSLSSFPSCRTINRSTLLPENRSGTSCSKTMLRRRFWLRQAAEGLKSGEA